MINPIDLVPKALRRAQLVLMRKRFARSVRPHRVTALGDSITHGLGQAGHVTNLGFHGQTTHGLLRSMPYYDYSVRGAAAVLLMIGTNDVWQNQTEGIERRLEAIVGAIPPDKPLIWSSIPPTGHGAFDLRRMVAVNQFIERMVQSRPNTAFIDTWALFTDERGFLYYDFFLADRVHLSPAGYHRWTKAIKDDLRVLDNPDADGLAGRGHHCSSLTEVSNAGQAQTVPPTSTQLYRPQDLSTARRSLNTQPFSSSDSCVCVDMEQVASSAPRSRSSRRQYVPPYGDRHADELA